MTENNPAHVDHVDDVDHVDHVDRAETVGQVLHASPWMRIAIGGVMVLVIGAAIALWAVTIQSTRSQWSPLGDFPDQTVLSVTDVFVEIEGTKCYDEPVRVRGGVGWRAVDPPGALIVAGEGVADREQGCFTEVFRNPIPVEVLALEEALDQPVVWQLTGWETPVDESHDREGVTGVWISETFTLID